ncbi:MAG: phage baseplate upper protein, partial [Tetragenococcus halophilus]|nr:phage baseplate upper protein [Tetragenococcus halophilus]
MKIYKNKDITTSIDTEKMSIDNSDTHFYTEDKGSAALRIFINHHDAPFNLDNTNLIPILDLLHSDGSVWFDEPLEVIMSDKGILQYNIPDNVISHAGRIKAKLFLRNAEQSVHVANFTFDIRDSGIEGAVEKEISVNLVDDAVRRIVKENAIELLDDGYKEKINQDVVNYVASNPDKYKGQDGESLKYADLTTQQKEEIKSNITDQAVTDFVISDNSITPEKTTFFEVENSTNNLFNIDTLEKGKTVDAEGSIISDDIRWLSDFIPLDSKLEEQINITDGSYRIALYDKDKEFISRTGTNGTYYKPSYSTFTKYIRISGSKDPEEIMMNKGTELLPYEKQGYGEIKLKQEFLPLQPDQDLTDYTIPDNAVTSNKLEDSSVTPEKTTFFTYNKSANLLDINEIQSNTTIDADGTIIESSARWLTDFIPLDSLNNEKINITEGS